MKRLVGLICLSCLIGLVGMSNALTTAWGAEKEGLDVTLNISDKASLTQFRAYPGKWNNQPAVWIEAKIKNISQNPVQFKTRCMFPEEGISRGFWIPKVGNPPIQPGKEAKAQFPFPYGRMPSKLSLIVEAVSPIE
jgi:hypothetical protein